MELADKTSETITRYTKSTDTAIATATPRLQASESPNRTVRSDRIVAVDALRGFDMFWIVGGRELALDIAGLWGKPVPNWIEYHLDHPAWVGFSAWDLIMPLFLFVVGVAMPFSFARRAEDGSSAGQLSRKIVRRSVILFLLGMVVQGHLLAFDLDKLHIYSNTLQAIACGYLVTGFLLLFTGVRLQMLALVVMLAGYWAALKWLAAGSYGAGVLRPDANLALAIDEFVLGRFRDDTSHTWILTGMSFTAMVLLGAMAGHILRSALASLTKGWTLLGMGFICLVLGWGWAYWGHYPMIKHIWTGSMVLWAAGWCYLLLAAFYLIIDVAGYHRWAFPFVVIGMNAITIYVASWFIPFRAIAEGLVGGLASHLGTAGPVLISASSVTLVWLLLVHLYRQRIFLRV